MQQVTSYRAGQWHLEAQRQKSEDLLLVCLLPSLEQPVGSQRVHIGDVG